jgi:hypothetical protein
MIFTNTRVDDNTSCVLTVVWRVETMKGRKGVTARLAAVITAGWLG